MEKRIKLFGMNFAIKGNYLIGSSKDIDKLSFYIVLFVFSLIFGVCIVYSLL